MKLKLMMALLLATSFLVGCSSEKQMEEAIAKVLKENPKVLIQAIEKNPTEFVEAFQKAVKSAQAGMAKKREMDEKKKLEASFDKPLVPKIRQDESIRGTKGAPLVLVEYSDFECPFCTRGFQTVQAFMNKYPGKVSFIYKHLPLSFHKNANAASKYYEAIRLQDEKKAFKFHDAIFANQRGLKNGEGFLKKTAKSVGANMSRLAKDLNNPKVQARIDEDQKEAASFGMQGTPGFLLNGVPIKGAYPIEHFDQIVEELKKRGKVKL